MDGRENNVPLGYSVTVKGRSRPCVDRDGSRGGIFESKISERGFTILEVLIALLILSVGMLGLTRMQIAGIQGNAYGIEMTQATVLGQEKMEALKSMAYGAMAGGNGTVTRAGVSFARSWTVTPSGNISTIQVVVGWTDKAGQNRSVTLATLRANL